MKDHNGAPSVRMIRLVLALGIAAVLPFTSSAESVQQVRAREMAIGINLNYYARGFEEAFVPDYARYAETDYRRAFREDFLTDIAPFDTIRFHQWGRQEFNTEEEWADRQPENYAFRVGPERSWREEKIPLIWHIRLCNVANKNLWVNIPTRASADYVYNLALLIDEHLDPRLRIYVEYSNEVWNYDYGDDGMFGPENPPGTGQYTVALARGTELGYGLSAAERAGVASALTDQYEAERYYNTQVIADYVVYASARAWRQFERVFGPDAMGSRVVRVLPGQMPDPEGDYPRDAEDYPDERDFYLGSIDRHLRALENETINPWNQRADAYAVASYFGIGLAGDDPTVMDALLRDIKDTIVGSRVVRARLDRYRAETGVHLDLVAYEGGIHIWPHDSPLPANRDPRIYDLYTTWLDGIAPYYDLINHYSLVSPHGRFGDDNAFGLKEYQGQPEAEAHKFRAVADWIRG